MKKFYSVFGFLALLLLAGTALFHLALPDKAYSETEKRNLAGAPVLSAERIFDGRAMTDIEAYAADQFPLRAFWMHARMNLMQAEGLRENEGVVLLSDGSLAECFDGWDEEKMTALAGALRRFAGENEFRAVYLLPVTTKSGLYPELFPDWLTPASQRLCAERLKEELRREVTVLDGCVYIYGMVESPGIVAQPASILRVFYGFRPDMNRRLELLAEKLEPVLNQAGIEGHFTEQIQREALQKFSYVSPLGAAGLYFDAVSGDFLKEGEPRSLFVGLIKEIEALGNGMGIQFEKSLVDVNLKLMDSFTKDLTTSMQRDVAHGGPSEFDGLVHRVPRLGKEYHVPTPLYDKISDWGIKNNIR